MARGWNEMVCKVSSTPVQSVLLAVPSLAASAAVDGCWGWLCSVCLPAWSLEHMLLLQEGETMVLGMTSAPRAVEQRGAALLQPRHGECWCVPSRATSAKLNLILEVFSI